MLFDLPLYWKECRAARAVMDVEETRVAYGPHRRQYAVVVRPREAGGREAGRIAFYFHGGGWTFGRPETFTPAAAPWLERGFTVILPSYRRPPAVGLRRIVEDCRAAIGHFASEATELHVGGISAGAHLAGLLAARPDWWRSAGWNRPPGKALLCAGPLSFRSLPVSSLLPSRYADLDAERALGEVDHQADTAWQLLHGTHDLMVRIRHSRRFLERLRESGHRADLHTIQGGRHLDAGRWMFGGPTAGVVRRFIEK